jgi:hypothetical protein
MLSVSAWLQFEIRSLRRRPLRIAATRRSRVQANAMQRISQTDEGRGNRCMCARGEAHAGVGLCDRELEARPAAGGEAALAALSPGGSLPHERNSTASGLRAVCAPPQWTSGPAAGPDPQGRLNRHADERSLLGLCEPRPSSWSGAPCTHCPRPRSGRRCRAPARISRSAVPEHPRRR